MCGGRHREIPRLTISLFSKCSASIEFEAFHAGVNDHLYAFLDNSILLPMKLNVSGGKIF